MIALIIIISVVQGIAKCGTTALCDKLVTHPDVRYYRTKETDIFTKLHFSIANFEKEVNTEFDYTNTSTALAHKHAKQARNPGRHQGNVWLDCSAGAFRDFNAAAHLRKYSPDTKVVLIVRDPWQVGEQH